MTDDTKQTLPTWVWIMGSTAMTLTIVGIIVGPDLNLWKVAGGVVGGVGLIAIIVWTKTKGKKG